jgi:hypothetical protein
VGGWRGNRKLRVDADYVGLVRRDHFPRYRELGLALEYEVGRRLRSIPEVAMMILIPFKPVILVLGLLTGLIFVGFVGSSLLEGKEPFLMDRGQARHLLIKQDHPRKAASVRVQ